MAFTRALIALARITLAGTGLTVRTFRAGGTLTARLGALLPVTGTAAAATRLSATLTLARWTAFLATWFAVGAGAGGVLMLTLGARLLRPDARVARLLALAARAAFLPLTFLPLTFAPLLTTMLEDALHRLAVVGAVGGDGAIAGTTLAARLLPTRLLATRVLPARLLTAGLLPTGLLTAGLLATGLLLPRLLLLTALPLPLRADALPLLGSLPLVLALPLL
ncbi:MAG: hypothetical protein WCR51_10840, partial [Planctomycetia bacterium]